MQTKGLLTIVRTIPTPRASETTEESTFAWFPLPDSVEELQQQPGSPLQQADHTQGVQRLVEHLHEFGTRMRETQDLHTRGEYQRAMLLWRKAIDMMPDPLEKGRAMRGYAASAARLGNYWAAGKWAASAFELHGQAANTVPAEFQLQALRQRGASAGMLGRLIVGSALRRERAGRLSPRGAREEAREGLSYFDAALEDILSVEIATGGDLNAQPDQERINLVSRMAIAYALVSDRPERATTYSRAAADFGWK
ncbi:MAG TPA: hypothetical protein VKQ34_00655, partial [Candidatus Saccharimonadales bacterium]|nr:hypothetical protein [Candidatus Saccharimonadales bacterium]